MTKDIVAKTGKGDGVNLRISGMVKTILFAGDTVPNVPFMLSESFKSFCDRHDLRVFNMEGSFSNSQKHLFKAGPHLLLNNKYIDPIAECFNIATLANNHSMDFGSEGLKTTIQICREKGIATVGAGMNLAEAFLPLDIGNCRIISIAENEFGAAQENKAGIATVDNPLKLYRSIKEGREAGKFVVVVAHGGTEVIPIPPPYLRERYKLWIEYGADLIIGNHPHVVQGHERHKGKSIFYSLGNFAFFNDSFKKYPNANWSIVVSMDIANNQISVIPVLPDKDRVINLSDNRSYVEEFKRLCSMINSPDYQSMYQQIAAEKYSSWYSRLATKSPEDAALLLHYFRCDAHRNMVQSALSQAIGESKLEKEVKRKIEDVSNRNNIDLGRDDENWFTHEQAFSNLLGAFVGRPNLLFLELGSWKGRSALWLAENILTGENSRLICVDVWDVSKWNPKSTETQQLLSNPKRMKELKIESLYETFLNNTKKLRHKIVPMRMRTIDALKEFVNTNTKFDFIYIDADHSEEAVYEDFSLSYKCIKPSGIIFFDDLSWPSVQKAIERIQADFGILIKKADQNGAYYIHRNKKPRVEGDFGRMMSNNKIIGFTVAPFEIDHTDVDVFKSGLNRLHIKNRNQHIYLWGIGDIERCMINDCYTLSFPHTASLLDRNVLLKISEDKVELKNDWLGSIPVFYNEQNRSVSTLINKVLPSDQISIDNEGLKYYFQFGYCMFTKTPVKGVRFLRYWSRVELTKEQINIIEKDDPVHSLMKGTFKEEDTFDLIRKYVNDTENQVRGDIILPTSGGYDSRLLNVLVKDKQRIQSFTYGLSENQSKSFEVVIARKLSELLGTKWNQIELGEFNKYISEWFFLYGISTHTHGMYHIEFYHKIRAFFADCTRSQFTLLSGIFGDVWAGNVAYQEVNSHKDLRKLGYTHGMDFNEISDKIESEDLEAKSFYDKYKENLKDYRWQPVITIRAKIILISYLMNLPDYFGFPSWTPYLNFDIVGSMLNIPKDRWKDRRWQKDFFVKNNLDLDQYISQSDHSNVLNLISVWHHMPEILDRKLLSDYVDQDTTNLVNSNLLKYSRQASLENTSANQIVWIHYIKYLILKALELLLSKKTSVEPLIQLKLLNQLGEDLFNKGDTQGALTAFKKAIEIDPSFATAYNNLGVLYWQNGEAQRAVDHFEKALEIDPNDRDTIFNYGTALTSLKKFEDAKNLYSSYLQKKPEDEEILSLLRAVEGKKMNNINSIQKAYEKVRETKINDPNWLKNDGKGRVEFCTNFLKANNKITSNTKILDVGCGRGTLANYLDHNVYLYGIDISEKAISEARKVYKQVDLVDLNSEKLPYEEKFFDIVITLDVIEHVFDPAFFLRELHRVLKSRGELILSTPNILNENLLKSFVHNRRFPKTSGDSVPYDGGHIHFFTYQDIFDLMKSVGFNFIPIGPLRDRFDYEFKESMVWVLGKKI